jgi:hypothetical protein
MRWLLASLVILLSSAAHAELVNYPNYLLSTGGTLTGALEITSGHLTLGLNQRLVLDDDLDSYIQCTADDTCNLYANDGIAIQWTASGITFSKNTSSASVAVSFASATTFRIAANEAAVPTEPVACASGTFGTMRAQNDTNDGAHSQVCYCGQLANDSTYDWLIVGTTTACPFF